MQRSFCALTMETVQKRWIGSLLLRLSRLARPPSRAPCRYRSVSGSIEPQTFSNREPAFRPASPTRQSPFPRMFRHDERDALALELRREFVELFFETCRHGLRRLRLRTEPQEAASMFLALCRTGGAVTPSPARRQASLQLSGSSSGIPVTRAASRGDNKRDLTLFFLSDGDRLPAGSPPSACAGIRRVRRSEPPLAATAGRPRSCECAC